MKLNLPLLTFLSILILCAIFIICFHYSFGPQWFSIFGSNILILGLLLSGYLFTRFMRKGSDKSEVVFLILTIFLGIAFLLNIGFWVLFFRIGPTNPELGLFREILRPSFETYGPAVSIALLLTWLVAAIRSFRR